MYMPISWHSTEEEQRPYDEEGASTPLGRDCRAGQAEQKRGHREDVCREKRKVYSLNNNCPTLV